jgi:multidrug efflux system membrane fusion protein
MRRPWILLVIAAAVGATACGPAPVKNRERPAVPVTVVAARLATVPIEVEAVGTVVPIATVDVGVRTRGEIKKIHFREGAMVKKDQLLFEMDPAPLQAALAQAEAVLARDRVQAETARADAERYRQILDKQLVSESEAGAKLAEANALAATLVADEAQVAAARLNLSWTRVTAPITGRADALRVAAGNVVDPNGAVVVTLRQLSPIQVSFALPQARLLDVQQLMKAGPLAVTATLPDHPEIKETGRLTFVAGAVDPLTGSINCKAEFANTEERLWPGAFVRVLLMLGERADAVVVPAAAIQPGQDGSIAFVVNDGVAELRHVKTGLTAGDDIVVESGVVAGEVVVVDGQMALGPGARVALKAPVGQAAPATPPAGEEAARGAP